MANPTRGTSPLLPIAIVAVAVIAIIVGVFAIRGEGPPDEATIISEDINAEPAGAGTAPEAEGEGGGDMEEEGVTDQLDEVTPVAEGEETIPAAEGTEEGGTDAAGDSEEEQSTTEGSEADAGEGSSTAPDEEEGASEAFLQEEGSAAPEDANVDQAGEAENEGLPEGRDAQTRLTPSDCQEIVADEDDGGAAVVPTPSGPSGNTGECLDSAQ